MQTFGKLHQTWVKTLAAVSAVAAIGLYSGAAVAQNWPSKPVRLVVCFPPGNAADVIARTLGPSLAQRLGQPVVVENRGGAGGIIGVDAVAKSPADGYTLGMCSLSPFTIIPSVRRKMPYNPTKDIAPILLATKGPMVVLVKKDSPIDSLEKLVQLTKADPQKYTYASLGPGTISQMSTEAFKAASGAALTEITYKGSSQALMDLIGGHVDVMIDGVVSAAAQMSAGTVKALGVTTAKRSSIMPDVMTLSESNVPGLKNFDVFGWVGLFAPAGVPAPIATRVHNEVADILRDPEVVKRINAAGQDVAEPTSPTQFKEFMQKDLERWTGLARKLKIEIAD
ncbi:tripartite tricarboxylate transporter substrate binding protein [uncultured Azohydromonas sp.]|jgi:Uncharacterized protein conserved in bacteria|uniref:Bug family tripartite tricarboxylate transporter substrate binding protein n=1 Tax=uncultured Azohydromonas sp. TaxID=487342 RepID=UPI002605ADDA|nr:tripartite tricarboxylate transporter substrate binding protein [uncultured Azohydromonas sp.]